MRRREFLTGSASAAFGSALPLELVSPIGPAWGQGAGTAPKPPSRYTIEANKKYLALPFDNRQDFADAEQGFIAGLPDGVIKNARGEVVFRAKDFEVDLNAPPPDWMNPSLWRICKLNGKSGLFKVTDRLYQVRNIDVANLTIMEGDTGLIIIDCTQTEDAARAGLNLYYEHRPKKPVVAVILTHSHVDHFGGIGGVTTAEDVASRKCRVIAPTGFTGEAVSENLYVGNAMFRRATFMYGTPLRKGPGADETLGSGLGVIGASQPPTLFTPQDPDDWVTETGQTKTIDGVKFEFLLAPGSEAPSEMHFFSPDLGLLCTAENAVHTLHNFYTLRGAKTRDISKWVKYLNQTLDMWGDKADVLYAPHHWPIWGRDNIRQHIENYRDAFKYIHDRSLWLANSGNTMPEIGELVQMPPELAKNWATRGYYGTVSHDSRAVYNFYLGYFSANPAELNPLPPVQAAPYYVDMMGGAANILAKAKQYYDQGQYRWVAQLLEHLVYAQPNNQEARNLQADAFEQLGYQSEAATWRNFYMVGAKELRFGTPNVPVDATDSPDLIKSMTLEMACDYVGISLNSEAAKDKVIKINLNGTDGKTTTEVRSLVLKNRVINSRAMALADKDLTLTGLVGTLNEVLLSGDPAVADAAIKSGKITAEGNPAALTDLLVLMTEFPFWFPIITRPPMS
jgi:alkyl sulfatase BDS1-like metallo-beta-lactamase superfamily hydrolase